MICASCGTWNREGARFCKHCAARLEPPPPGGPPAARDDVAPRLPPPPAGIARAWWHPIGVSGILAAFVAFIDLAADGLVSWSLVVVLGLAFLAGGLLILRFLATSDRTDRRPFFVGAVLLVAAVFLLPLTLALQGSATTTETFVVPYDPGIRNLNLDVSDDAGEISVAFVEGTAFLARAEVVHLGGVFTSHSAGDVIATNTTAGDTVHVRIAARSVAGLFLVGGHHIRVSIQRDLSVALALESTAGSVAVDVASGVAVRSLAATVTTGSVRLTSRDAVFANGATVRLDSATGGVSIDLEQASGGPGTVSVAGASAAGRVAFRFVGGPAVGGEVRASAASGPVTVDASKYESIGGLLYAPSRAAFEGADLKFIVELATTTGSVQVG